MKIHLQAPLLDQILETWRAQLGPDFASYRNHCYRVLNFCQAFCAEDPTVNEKICIAVAFHDLGIWTHHSFDYLAPSRQLAREYLVHHPRQPWTEEVEAMIENHHRVRTVTDRPDWLVESFRKADWVDVSLGWIRMGLPRNFVAEVRASFPNAGFHKRLAMLTLQRLKTHPWSPLPMMRF